MSKQYKVPKSHQQSYTMGPSGQLHGTIPRARALGLCTPCSFRCMRATVFFLFLFRVEKLTKKKHTKNVYCLFAFIHASHLLFCIIFFLKKKKLLCYICWCFLDQFEAANQTKCENRLTNSNFKK